MKMFKPIKCVLRTHVREHMVQDAFITSYDRHSCREGFLESYFLAACLFASVSGVFPPVPSPLTPYMYRKGFVDGRIARLPTVIVRPGPPNPAATGCFSSVPKAVLNVRTLSGVKWSESL